MNFLLLSSEKIHWSEFCSNIATMITGASALAALICLIVRTFTKNKFICEIFLTKTDKTNDGIRILFFDATFYNLSNNEKCITSITLSYNKDKYPTPVFRGNSDTNYIEHKWEMFNEIVPTHQSKTLNCLVFDSDNVFNGEKPVILRIKTPGKNFKCKTRIDFGVLIPKNPN